MGFPRRLCCSRRFFIVMLTFFPPLLGTLPWWRPPPLNEIFDLQPIKRFQPPTKMKKGSCSPPDGKAASQVHFFDRADAGVGLSGEVAANAPLSRDVKEGGPYQIQGGIPDNCHGHPGWCSCKNILSGVKFSRLNTKTTYILLFIFLSVFSKFSGVNFGIQ